MDEQFSPDPGQGDATDVHVESPNLDLFGGDGQDVGFGDEPIKQDTLQEQGLTNYSRVDTLAVEYDDTTPTTPSESEEDAAELSHQRSQVDTVGCNT